MNLTEAKFTELFIPGHYLEPEKAGAKHVIFSMDLDRPLITVLIDNKPPSVKIWDGDTNVLFGILERWGASEHLRWFHVSEHDCAQAVVNRCEDAKRPLDLNKLFCFEVYHDDEGGNVQLCLAPLDYSWLVVISRGVKFEIAFYGEESRWNDLLLAMKNISDL